MKDRHPAAAGSSRATRARGAPAAGRPRGAPAREGLAGADATHAAAAGGFPTRDDAIGNTRTTGDAIRNTRTTGDAIGNTRTTGDAIGEVAGIDRVEAGATGGFRVAGFSLLPVVPPGARLEVRVPAPGEPKVGDLAVVRIGPGRFCHLVVEAEPPSAPAFVVTRGTWSRANDPRVPRENVVGVVTAVRWMGVRVPTGSPLFEAWLAAGLRCAPVVRWSRDALWLSLPEAARSVLRRAVGRRRS